MKVLVPVDITDSTLTSINVPENDYPLWSAATSYSRGAFVISTATHTVYRSLQDTNLGNDPDLEAAALADPLVENPATQQWQVIGATNRWRLFDKKPSQPCVFASEINVETRPGEFINGVCGFRVEATQVQVTVRDTDNTLLYDRTVDMTNSEAITDWLKYFIEPITFKNEFVLLDLPLLGAPRITVRATGTTDVRIGQIVYGRATDLGMTGIDGTRFSGLDFSFVQTDEFGNLSTVKRAATQISDFSFLTSTANLFSFRNLMDQLRGGEPAVWIGDDTVGNAAVNYGFYLNYSAPYETAEWSIVSVEVQGIV